MPLNKGEHFLFGWCETKTSKRFIIIYDLTSLRHSIVFFCKGKQDCGRLKKKLAIFYTFCVDCIEYVIKISGKSVD